MKKIIMALLALAILAVPTMQGADLNKQLQKAQEKEVKAKLKEYKKEGWKVLGSTSTLEVCLLKHYNAMNEMGDNAQEFAGIVSKCKSKNIGKQMALNNATTLYAQSAGSSLAGRVVSDMSGSSTDPDTEFDNFYAAYERSVEKEIKGEMQESFSIYRDNGDGTFEVQSFFIVNEEKASQARMRALDQAFQESEAARKNADKISEFVRNRVEQ